MVDIPFTKRQKGKRYERGGGRGYYPEPLFEQDFRFLPKITVSRIVLLHIAFLMTFSHRVQKCVLAKSNKYICGQDEHKAQAVYHVRLPRSLRRLVESRVKQLR